MVLAVSRWQFLKAFQLKWHWELWRWGGSGWTNSERTAPAQRQAHQAADNGNQELLKQGTTVTRKILELPYMLLGTGKLQSIKQKVGLWQRDSSWEVKGRNAMWKIWQGKLGYIAKGTLTTRGGKSVLIIKPCSAPPSCPSSWHIVRKTMSNPVGTTPNHHHRGHQCQDNTELAVEKSSQKRSKERLTVDKPLSHPTLLQGWVAKSLLPSKGKSNDLGGWQYLPMSEKG